ncbi:hypothetical protein FDECE_10172 [Fusarium decemcellulare]|nr:hypothetical protein FDECE_10172 [Fusarium decemcellulare]
MNPTGPSADPNMEPEPQISGENSDYESSDDEILDYYRDREILLSNGMIYLEPYRAFKEVPPRVKKLVKKMVFLGDYSSLDEEGEDIKSTSSLRQIEESSTPAMIMEYWRALPSERPAGPDLYCSENDALYRKWMPRVPGMETFGDPEPAMLYGYHLKQFGPSKVRRLKSLSQAKVNNGGLLYPFLAVVIQDHDDSIMKRSHGAATDTCLASSSVCINVMQKLRQDLKASGARCSSTTNDVAFSVAMNGTLARLYVTFVMDNGTYAMYNARSFLLQNPDHHLEFRTSMLHILEWGQDRLGGIAWRLRSMVPEAS